MQVNEWQEDGRTESLCQQTDSVTLWVEFIWWGLRWPFVDLLCYVKSQRQTAHGKMSFQRVWPNQSSITATGVWKKRLSLFSKTGKSLLSPEESCVSSALQGPMLYQFPSDFFPHIFSHIQDSHEKLSQKSKLPFIPLFTSSTKVSNFVFLTLCWARAHSLIWDAACLCERLFTHRARKCISSRFNNVRKRKSEWQLIPEAWAHDR